MNIIKNKTIKNESASLWTSFLDPSFNDPYMMYKDKISFQLENMIVNIEKELMLSNPEYKPSTAREMAIYLIMERMLVIQHEYAPKSMTTMVASLLLDLPNLNEFRFELFEKVRNSIQKPKPSFFEYVKKIFK
ncbi:hypothetical protein GW796_08770 [archaeon]|nr:hypothetical protein [archaeon]NCQ51971.1 hypothetical protein [archaeon]